jgi:hypothetical protein
MDEQDALGRRGISGEGIAGAEPRPGEDEQQSKEPKR